MPTFIPVMIGLILLYKYILNKQSQLLTGRVWLEFNTILDKLRITIN